jgi:hypothetical protein
LRATDEANQDVELGADGSARSVPDELDAAEAVDTQAVYDRAVEFVELRRRDTRDTEPVFGSVTIAWQGNGSGSECRPAFLPP